MWNYPILHSLNKLTRQTSEIKYAAEGLLDPFTKRYMGPSTVNTKHIIYWDKEFLGTSAMYVVLVFRHWQHE